MIRLMVDILPKPHSLTLHNHDSLSAESSQCLQVNFQFDFPLFATLYCTYLDLR